MSHDKQDHYYKKAKIKGYRARSAFKLEQIQKRFFVIKRGYSVVDLGAAPGSWTQVASNIVGNKGNIIAVDINYIIPFENDNITILQVDMRSNTFKTQLSQIVDGKIDVVLSDLAANTSGNWSLDVERQVYLATIAFETAEEILRPGGNFVTKVFRGNALKEFEDLIKGKFTKIKHWRPPATRKQSAEEYIICKGYLSDDQE